MYISCVYIIIENHVSHLKGIVMAIVQVLNALVSLFGVSERYIVIHFSFSLTMMYIAISTISILLLFTTYIFPSSCMYSGCCI